MKRILVPVDFSSNAEEALAYALELARGLHIQLMVILHVQKPGSPQVGGSQSVRPQEDLEQMTARAEEALGEEVTVLSKVLRGQPEVLIERLARQFETDLIIMGATGSGHCQDKGQFLGSVSGTMFKHTELPMLFIPRGTTFQKPERLSFIMKSLMIYREGALKPLLGIASAFGATLDVVQIKAASVPESYGKESNLELAGSEYNVYQLTCADVPSGIQRVIGTFDPQLLCVIRRKRDFFEALFKAPSMSAADFSSSVPVLVLQGVR